MKKAQLALLALLLLGVAFAVIAYLQAHSVAILDPKGTIALQERNLMTTALALMMLVLVPVYGLTFFIAWKYRAGNAKAKYSPDWDHNRLIEMVWWIIPSIIILALAVITWTSSHSLDPFRPIESKNKAITIQVVALQWKWLFIYPEQNIATVNFVEFPEDTPVNFEITSDAPMNSFWIPQLGGQIYAMAGMKTKLHLMASDPGNFQGSSANISGEGFAKMKFTAKATTRAEFDEWVMDTKQNPARLSRAEYDKLAQPSKNTAQATYSSAEKNLFDDIIMKYMPETH